MTPTDALEILDTQIPRICQVSSRNLNWDVWNVDGCDLVTLLSEDEWAQIKTAWDVVRATLPNANDRADP